MKRPARVCRTPEECFEAGWNAAEDAPPLTERQVDQIVALIGPSIRRTRRENAAAAA